MRGLFLLLALAACSGSAPDEHSYTCRIQYTCDRDVWGSEWNVVSDAEYIQEIWLADERICAEYLDTYVCRDVTSCEHTCVPLAGKVIDAHE